MDGQLTCFKPEATKCAICSNLNQAMCSKLPFDEMTPVLDRYTDSIGVIPMEVRVVECVAFEQQESKSARLKSA